jgi:hypothetical protein
MKKIITVLVCVFCSVASVLAQDYSIGFNLSSLTGKYVEDGYYSQNIAFRGYTVIFDCTIVGETTDQFYGVLYDANGADYWWLNGHIVWNDSTSPTKGSIQGTGTYAMNGGLSTAYLDGTIKVSRGRFSITAKAGESDTYSYNYPYLIIYNNVKGSGGLVESAQTTATGQRSDTLFVEKPDTFRFKK